MIPELPETWKTLLTAELCKPYFETLSLDINASYLIGDPPIFPPAPLVFNALTLCSPNDVRVVILGQDPYHAQGQAMGLSFSVPDGVHIPPSLQNIYKEILADLGAGSLANPDSGDLTKWAQQGILLLNTTLTVESGRATSHQGKGWEQFTDQIIQTVSDQQDHMVFMFWGKSAEAKSSLTDNTKHLILTAPHPSPLSAHRGFLGCRHFSQCNEYLKNHAIEPIEW